MTENRMKRKKTGMIWLIFTIIWMSVIFSFSAKKAVESEGMSHSVGKEIGRLIVPQFTSWSEERQEQFAKMIDFPVRKCAHATEYAVSYTHLDVYKRQNQYRCMPDQHLQR